MNEFDEFEPDNTNVIFRDVILLALMGFMAMVIIMMPHINPPGHKTDGAKVPGNLIVEIVWDPSRNIDIDLWLQHDNEPPNGYSNKDGATWNLLRDDLGFTSDVSKQNYEIAFTRGIIAGEYIINTHYYKNHGATTTPIEVQVVVSIKPKSGTVKLLDQKTVTMYFENQEITVIRFTLNERGKIEVGSRHTTPKKIRVRPKGMQPSQMEMP